MIDQLLSQIKDKNNPSVIGLDPSFAMIPGGIRQEMLELYGPTPQAVAQMFLRFNQGIIDAIHDLVPAVKPQIAMYEQYGLEGIRAYLETIAYAREKGLVIIGDIKRGDIASTAAAYAGHIGGVTIEGQFHDPWQEDFITVNPYFGIDGIKPFFTACQERNKGLFVLVRTSNPSSVQIQDLMIGSQPFYEKVGTLVSEWGEQLMGNSGYSRIGAVVGATHPEQGEALRKQMPNTFFLVPGYGAQGATASDIKGFFRQDGTGAIVNSSRGILAAHEKDPECGEEEFAQAARKAVLRMKQEFLEVLS